MRFVLSLAVGVAAAALGALILGEYQLAGFTGLIAGSLFGLAVAEVVLTTAGDDIVGRDGPAMVATAVLTAGGLAWAAWISAGHDWGYVPTGAWIGLAAGAVLAPWWLRGGARRAGRPRTSPPQGDLGDH